MIIVLGYAHIGNHYRHGQGCGMHQFVKSSNELLRKLGYRLTPQRYMILSVIQEASEHLTIDQITERVQQRNPMLASRPCIVLWNC